MAFIPAIASVLFLSSCSAGTSVDDVPEEEIPLSKNLLTIEAFDQATIVDQVPFDKTDSRAASQIYSLDNFRCYAWYGNTGTALINGDGVSYANSKYDFDNNAVYYWPKNNTPLHFYGVYPTSVSMWPDGNIAKLWFEVPENANVDLVTGHRRDQYFWSNTDGKVPLYFSHALCGIKVKVNVYPSNYNVSVWDDIWLQQLKYKGTYTINGSETPSELNWWSQPEASRSRWALEDERRDFYIGKPGDMILIMPQRVDRSLNRITFNMSLYDENSNDVTKYLSPSGGNYISVPAAPEDGWDWVPGKMYTLNVNLNLETKDITIAIDNVDNWNREDYFWTIPEDPNVPQY